MDVVHVQADFWGAFTGHRFAARHGLPVVHTMHNRVDVGIEATAPFPGLVLRVLNAWQRRALRRAIRPTARRARRLVVPAPLRRAVGCRHRARRRTSPAGSRSTGSCPAASGAAPGVDVVWNGIDDDVLDAALARATAGRAAGRPRFVWLGRMSPEKRLLPFLEALAESGIDADVEIIGGGGQERAARRLVQKLGLSAPVLSERRGRASVVFAGRMPYAETLRRIAAADAVVQTSIGFETQGMTVFEAASLGTPAVVSDPDIAAELGSGYWPVADASTSALSPTRCARRPPTSRPARARRPTRRSASGSASRRARRRWSRSTPAPRA